MSLEESDTALAGTSSPRAGDAHASVSLVADRSDGSDRLSLAARIWTPPGWQVSGWQHVGLRVGCSRISGLSAEAFSLLANMDSRPPRANRGTGVKRQGCYRPDAVSVEPKGHGSRHSLSISGEGIGSA